MFPFTDLSRRGRSDETPLRVTCEWPYVPSNEHGNCKNVETLLCYVPSYEQSDLPNKAINIFIISWYIHNIRSLAYDLYWSVLRSPMLWHISKGEHVRRLILIRLSQFVVKTKIKYGPWNLVPSKITTVTKMIKTSANNIIVFILR